MRLYNELHNILSILFLQLESHRELVYLITPNAFLDSTKMLTYVHSLSVSDTRKEEYSDIGIFSMSQAAPTPTGITHAEWNVKVHF